jgi:hypothetical protein
MNERCSADRKAVDVLRTILTEHFALASSSAISNDAEQFKKLLEGFGIAYAVAAAAEVAEAKRDRETFETFFPDYDTARQLWREAQVGRADGFNLLEVMQVTWKEACHSRVLAWLFDWDMTRLGTHAQGNLGFRFFLEEVGLPLEYATEGYRVSTESPGDESRIDVEVMARGRFVIYIENKIRADEGYEQTTREWRDLERTATALKHGFYLTPGGVEPRNRRFQAISWRRMATVFDRFADVAKPKDVALFARHYANVLKTNIVPPEVDDEEVDDGCGQVQ